jgi:hypothetical protein
MGNKANIPIIEDGEHKEADGTIKYYKNNVLHNDNGPAVIFPNGVKQWWTKGRMNKEEFKATSGTSSLFFSAEYKF